MQAVISTLTTYALYLLRPGGRLVFFLPTSNADYDEALDVPRVEGLRLVSNCLQDYGKWGRRLITMEKTRAGEAEGVLRGLDRGIERRGGTAAGAREGEQGGEEGQGEERKRPGHADFNRRFFAGFDEVREGVKKLVVGGESDAATSAQQ